VTAADVLHSWAVPSLGIKVDACTGRLNQTSVFILRSGVFLRAMFRNLWCRSRKYADCNWSCFYWQIYHLIVWKNLKMNKLFSSFY
jgi:hypothetical protein